MNRWLFASVLLLLGMTLVACDEGSTIPVGRIPSPSLAYSNAGYGGASGSDFWALGPIAHWNGSTWREFAGTLPIPYLNAAAPAGPGRLWIQGADSGGAQRLARVAVDGTYEDFTSELARGNGSGVGIYSFRGVTALVFTGLTSTSMVAPKVLVQGDGAASFQELPALPAGVWSLGGAAVFSKDDIYVRYSTSPSAAPTEDRTGLRDLPSDVLHWDGSRWDFVTSNRSALTGTTITGGTGTSSLPGLTPSFPSDDVWGNCGESATRFDGVSIRPLGVPLVSTPCYFAYKGRPRMLFPAVYASGDPGSAQVCDVYGNCQSVDTYTTVGVEWHVAEWNGTGWTSDTSIATVDACVGAACGYGAASRFGVVGTLDDGTTVFVGSTRGKEYLWLVE